MARGAQRDAREQLVRRAVDESGTSPSNQVELQLSAPRLFENWLIRHNSFRRGVALRFNGGATHRNFRVIGNVGYESDCDLATAGVTWAYNVWMDKTCNGTERQVGSLPYVSTAIGAEDFHLTGGVAQDLVTPAGADYALASDIDGHARPLGGARDAGADER